ncbi:MAG: hypothetical protein AAF958_12810 [Planctomycetota bacterium]
MLDPFAALLAVLPVVVYIIVLSAIRLSGRALVTTGARDTAALAMAVSGFIAIGPAQLFFPRQAAIVFGPTVWLAIATLYGLFVALYGLVSRPSLVVYGRTPGEVYPRLLAAAKVLDADAGGNEQIFQVHLPNLQIDLRCDGGPRMDFARIVSFQPIYNAEFWIRLLVQVRRSMADQPAPQRVRGGLLELLIAVTLAVSTIAFSFQQTELLVTEFRRWLWR